MNVRTLGLPHILAAAACLGLAGSNLARVGSTSGATVCALVLLATPFASRRAHPVLVAVAVAIAAITWGSVRLDALDRSALVNETGRVAPTTAVITGPGRRSRFATRVPAEIRRFGRARLQEPVLLVLPPGRAPPQGAIVELIGRVALPRASEAGFDERRWLARRGVQVVVESMTARVRIVGRRHGFMGLADRLRARVLRDLAPGVRGERRAVIAGIVLGEDEALPEDLRNAFRSSGLYHLLAVSGQNVAFLAWGVLGLAWLLAIPRWAAEVGALATIGAYVFAVGWQPSVVRAGVAGCLASLAWLSARPRDRWHFLLLGAVVLLAWNPYTLLDPGFQLSFAAVAAIFVAVPRLESWFEGYPVPKSLAAVIALSAACGVATAPILWLQFGAVPVYSIVANAIAAPVVAPLLGLGLLCALATPFAPGAAAALAWTNGWFAAYLAACARAVASIPHAQIASGTILVAAGAIIASALAASRLSATRTSPRRGPALAAAAIATAVTVGWRLWPSPAPPPPHGVRISFLDVGQGDSALIQTASAAVLVDEGPPEAEVARQLRRLGVRRLALLVLTHPQRDHIGGAADVLDSLPVERVLDPRQPLASPDERAALAAARRQGVPVDTARTGRTYAVGRLSLRVLSPPDGGTLGEDPNQRAIVLLVSYGQVDALLTADAEGDVTTPLRPPPVEILKVAHHGSADDLLPELLTMTHPQVAVISVGRGNTYGHPTPSTIAALGAMGGLDVYRTDRDGRIVVESDGRALTVRADR